MTDYEEALTLIGRYADCTSDEASFILNMEKVHPGTYDEAFYIARDQAVGLEHFIEGAVTRSLCEVQEVLDRLKDAYDAEEVRAFDRSLEDVLIDLTGIEDYGSYPGDHVAVNHALQRSFAAYVLFGSLDRFEREAAAVLRELRHYQQAWESQRK